jgi:hypothetical protein
MIDNYAYFYSMKTRLNLTIENALLSHVKEYAAAKEVSVSQIVEDYFESLVKPTTKRPTNIIELIDQLQTPKIEDNIDLKKSYYEERTEKYGF